MAEQKTGAKLKISAAELPSRLREIVTPKDGMSRATIRGLEIFGKQTDKELYRLFTQIHWGRIDKDILIRDVAKRLAEHLHSRADVVRLMMVYDRFRDVSTELIERDVTAMETVPGMDEIPDIDEYGLANLACYLAKVHYEDLARGTASLPALSKIDKLNKTLTLLMNASANKAHVARETGKREAPPQRIDLVRVDGAFQETVGNMTEEQREKYVDTMAVFKELLLKECGSDASAGD